jgi:phage terminase large subunit
VIVETFSAEWFSKHRFEEGGDISRKSSDGFAGYALKKMKDELKAGARSDAR